MLDRYHTDPNAKGYLNTANPHGHPVTNAAAGIMRTPVLDRLASEGKKLEAYYVQPLCSPVSPSSEISCADLPILYLKTRSTIMTGRYQSHTGIGPNVIVTYNPYGLPAREVLLPALLKDAGYATHAVGKV